MASSTRAWNRCWQALRANDPFAASPFRRAPYLAVAAAIVILHAGLFVGGDWAFSRAGQSLPAFPGYGLDLVILLAFGLRYWPFLLVAYLGDSLAKQAAWLPSCGVAGAALIRTLFGAWLIRRVSGLKKLLGPFEDLAGIGLAGVIATALGAVLGAAALVVAGTVSGSDWTGVFTRWWIADALGAFTATPTLLVIARLWTDGRPGWRPWFGVQSAFYMICVAVAGYLIFFRPETRYLLFSAFLLILIAAAWLGPAAARFAALIISFAAIGATRAGIGAFAGGSLRENLQNLAFFLLAVSFTGIAVGAFRAIGNLALPAGVLLVGWALSGWLYASMDRGRAAYDDARLDRMIVGAENRIATRYRTDADLSWSAAAFVAASPQMTPDSWRLYVTQLRLPELHPGTGSLSIVRPSGDAGLSSTASSVLADPLLLRAAERSRDSGQAVLTESAGNTSGGGPAVLLFVPVYREDAPLDSVVLRRSALRAWVTLTLDPDSLFQAALADTRSFLSLRVSSGPTDALISGAARPEAPPVAERTTRIMLGGNTWVLRWSRQPGFPYLSREPFALAAGCTALLSLFSAAMVLTLQTTRRRASDRLKLLQSALTLGTWEFDPDSQTLHCSEQFSRLYGMAHRERLPVQEWLDRLHPDDRETVAEWIRACAGNRMAVDRQYRVAWADGSVHWLHSKAIVVSEEQGAPSRVLGVDFDVSEIKQLQSQLAQAQKLQSVGQLAAGVAHEINTPIQYIGDNGKFLEDAFNDLIRLSDARRASPSSPGGAPGIPDGTYVLDDGAWEYLRKEVPKATTQLLEGVDQVARIVRAMKEFSHPGPVEKCAADINRAIENTILVSKNEWKYVANVTTDLDRDLPPVPCVVGEINQAILNLIVNAAHAIGEVVQDSGRKGAIHISTAGHDQTVEIRIADTGGGIPEAIQSKVFDPFFTTKPVGKGTGQGLAIAHAVIVQKHRGTITFESEPGRGTAFVIQLPLAREVDPIPPAVQVSE